MLTFYEYFFMAKKRKIRIKLVFFRTLFSQSGASLTMGYLASFLRKFGYKVDLCFLEKDNLHNAERILNNLTENTIIIAKPNFKDFKELLQLLSGLKEFGKIKRVFLCGPFSSLNSKSILKKSKWLDGIILDQIELTSLNLIESMNPELSEWNFNCLGGIWRDPNTCKLTNYISTIESIHFKELPFPARDIEKIEKVSYINIESSRGCLMNCSFCHVALIARNTRPKNKIEFRDPIQVVDEIEYLNKKLKKTLFIFNDSCFWTSSADNDRVLQICSEIKRRKLNIKMYVYLRLKPFIEKNVLKALVEVGLVRVFLGVENISERTQIIYEKVIEQEIFFEARKILENYNVNVHLGYMVFDPFSTLEDILNSFMFLDRIEKIFRLGVILEPVRVIPGSSLHKKLVESGLISEKLSYDKLTYGYKFKNKEVENFFKYLRKIFTKKLGHESYQFEYYSTSFGVLKTILERFHRDSSKNIKSESEFFLNLRKAGMGIIFDFLVYSLDCYREGKKVSKAEENRFIFQLKEVNQKVKIQYGYIVSIVEKWKGGEGILKEIYTGLERLNK